MVREAIIILPRQDNAGNPVETAHLFLQASLIEAFGGFTAASVNGAWRDETTGIVYRDESIEYRVAADWSAGKHAARLINIAGRAAHDADQFAVYVRDGEGVVHLIEAPQGQRDQISA